MCLGEKLPNLMRDQKRKPKKLSNEKSPNPDGTSKKKTDHYYQKIKISKSPVNAKIVTNLNYAKNVKNHYKNQA